MKYAYVTLLSTDNYLLGVLVLNRNLKKLQCKYPLFVLVTDTLKESTLKTLEKEGIQYKIVPYLHYSDDTISIWNSYSSTVKHTASKLHLFNLTEFDKIVYVDSDVIFFTSPDELFNKYDGSIYECYEGGDEGFSGLFVCTPANHNFEYYMTLIKHTKSLDGDLFAKLWFPFKSNPDYHIDKYWFINVVILSQEIEFERIKGIHFCNRVKPWFYDNVENCYNDITADWYNADGSNLKRILEIYFNEYLNLLKQELDNI